MNTTAIRKYPIGIQSFEKLRQEGEWSNSIRFMNVIQAAFGKTGQRVVVLIDEKEYLISYTVDGRKLIKVGAPFDKGTRNIERWLVGRS